MASQPGPLRGLRVLVAEDNVLAALELEHVLVKCGCQPVGPAATLEQALRLIRGTPLDGAILDVNLRDRTVFPAAEELVRRGIPLLFATGYEDSYIFPPLLADLPRLRKPYAEYELMQLLMATFAPA